MVKAKKFEDLKGNTAEEKLTYLQSLGTPGSPIYVQQKYNGVHCRVQVTSDGRFTFHTKPSKPWPHGKQWRPGFFGNIFDAFKDIKVVTPVNFYGELIIDNLPLQDIAAEVAVNRKELGGQAKEKLYLVLYDCFIETELIVNQPFYSRWRLLNSFVSADNDRLRVVTTYPSNVEWADKIYHNVLEADLEGVIYRVDPCFFIDNTESWHMIKRKRRHDMEGVVVEVIEGKGKHAGMLGAFVVKLPSGVTVKVGRGTGLTEEKMFRYWCNRALIIGQPLTFSYEEMSKAGVPLRNQFIAIRNYES